MFHRPSFEPFVQRPRRILPRHDWLSNGTPLNRTSSQASLYRSNLQAGISRMLGLPCLGWQAWMDIGARGLREARCSGCKARNEITGFLSFYRGKGNQPYYNGIFVFPLLAFLYDSSFSHLRFENLRPRRTFPSLRARRIRSPTMLPSLLQPRA